MPTYEYRCADGHEFELFQRMSDEPKATCPECGEPAQRLLSAGAGFLFKGDGFYITDYRSDEYRKAAKAESGNGSDAKKAETKKDGEKKEGASGAASSKKDAPSGGGAAKPGKGKSSSTESS